MADTPDAEIAAPTVLGDVRDALLDRLRLMPKTWSELSDDQQRDLIAGCEQIARHVIAESVRAISSQGFPTIGGKVIKAQIKDGMQVAVEVSRHDPQRLTVIDAVGRPVFLVVAEPSMFTGERAPAKTSLEERMGLK
jgi:hypothetical protein